MSHENEAILRKSVPTSISIKKMRRNTRDLLEVLLNMKIILKIILMNYIISELY